VSLVSRGKVDWSAFALTGLITRGRVGWYGTDSLEWNSSVLVGPVPGVLVGEDWFMSQSEWMAESSGVWVRNDTPPSQLFVAYILVGHAGVLAKTRP
jgi:hypothetical protein